MATSERSPLEDESGDALERSQAFGKIRLIVLLLVLVGAAALIPLVRSLPRGQASPSGPELTPAPAPFKAEPGNETVGIQPGFRFFSEVDRQQLAANLAQLDQPLVRQPRPEGMDNDVYAFCELLVNDDTQLKEQFRLATEQTVSIVDAGFIKDGEYLVTLGDKLIVWRTATGEKVREHALPVELPRRLLVGHDAASAVIVTENALVKCSLVDGHVLGEYKIQPGIASAAMAYQAGSLAVCTNEMQCWLVAADLKSHKICESAQLSVPKVAIDTNARSVLFFVRNHAARWLAEKDAIEALPTKEIKAETAFAVAAMEYDYIIDGFEIYAYDVDGIVKPIRQNTKPLPYYFNSVISQVFPTETGLDDSLLVVAHERPTQSPALRIVDVQPVYFAGSKESVISEKTEARVFANRTGESLAVLDADGLRVSKRRKWVSNDGKLWSSFLKVKFLEGRFEQLDLVGNYVRQHKRLPCNETGEAMFGALARTIASMWESCEGYEIRQALLEKAEQWKNSKSPLAVAASAQRHIQIGAAARGGGFANTVTDEGWKVFRERHQQAMKELSMLPENGIWPAVAYELVIEVLKDNGGTFDQADSVLKEYTTNYPFETMAHEIACAWSLPRWAGEPGQSGAYLTALAKLYPSEFSQVMYARVATAFKANQSELAEGEFGIDDNRMHTAFEALAKRAWISRTDMERAIGHTSTTGFSYVASPFVNRHLKEHDVAGREIYTNAGLKNLWIVRANAHGISLESK